MKRASNCVLSGENLPLTCREIVLYPGLGQEAR
ncbi:hypothetical protein HEB29_005578 [Streptomyces fulvorobeus]|uniref:Uncharacterized protein n=1 Tax=Streptomyces fulvorobeus TaxID=284028 RepID=A0A7Y9HHK1_9ACTN|nr:hypothetical protein [Streptomyces fulvorobeus]